MSTITEEIELLERVLLRLGMADTDEQLETAICKFLNPVLLKIRSPHEKVRCKVIEVLTHVNKRLKSRSMVQIPVESILDNYQYTTSTFLQNFSIIYITMGFPRLPVERQIDLLPKLLASVEQKPEQHQDKLLFLILPLLNEVKIPDDPQKNSNFLGLEDKPTVRKLMFSLLQDVLLLPYGVTSDAEVPAGLSTYSFKRIIVCQWKAEELERLKKGIVNFVPCGIFSNADCFTLLVVASADTRFSVATPAIAELSKISTTLDFTDPHVTASLYTLFSGNNSTSPEKKTTPCSARVRQKLLQYLIKSRGKGINTVRGIQVIFEGLFGENTNQKCKVLSLQFCENLVKDGPKDVVGKVSKVILSGLSKLLGRDSTEPIDVQNAAYSAMAQLVRTCPDIVNQDLKILVSYFNHLSSASPELHSSIRETLVAMAPAFSWNFNAMDTGASEEKFVLTSQQHLLLAMLSDNAESKLQIVQNVTSVFLTTCFPDYFAPARYLLLLIAGEGTSLRESVMSYLYGVFRKDNIDYNMLSSKDNSNNEISDDEQSPTEQRKVVLPSFKDMINYTFEMSRKRIGNSSQRCVVGKSTLAFKPQTYVEILDYLRICLWFSAGAKVKPGDDKYSHVLKEYIVSNFNSNKNNEINRYFQLVYESVAARRDETNLTCLYDLANAAPEVLTPQQQQLLEPLIGSLKDISESIRTLAAQIYGILLAHGFKDEDFNKEINEILTSLSQKSLENRHGWILVIGHAFNRKLSSLKDSTEFLKTVRLLVGFLCEQQWLLVSAAVKSLSLIGRVSELPNLNIDVHRENVNDMSVGEVKPIKEFVFENLFNLLKSTSVRQKIREDAASCLGYMAIGDGEFFIKRNLDKFLTLVKVPKDAALNIAIAQAVVCTLSGHDVQLGGDPITSVDKYCDDTTFEQFINALITTVAEPNPHSRQSTAVWLLAIVKNCNSNPIITLKKQILQYAFTELLSDDSEFIQDVASRGLGLVYSFSDTSSQEGLANSLLDQLIGGKRSVNLVAADTKLFEDEVLGKTPTGGNITTYKELCNLASDLNQPEMIYQFMQLANHNAAWTSKLGAAFGLKSISKDAKAQMMPYLGKIVPRLYRYKYDPTPKIQNSMISIWDSIISDSKKVVELYYWDIMKELTINLTTPEWRVRIACCLAVRDLIKRSNGLRLRIEEVRPDSKMEPMDVDDNVPEPELKELWTQLFRVMDDIHEGTRLAAEGTVNILSKICVSAASTAHGKSALAVVSSILPLLLDVGLIHTVPEIRKISIKTISELIEYSGSFIVPHLQSLIPCLLRATGELEAPKLSYLSTKLSAESDAQEAVDNIRAEFAKSHHTMQTISKCVNEISFEVLEKTTPAILDLIKSSSNLGTQIACAHFVCLISIRLGQEMTSLVSKYLAACFGGLKNRNATVRKYFASAIGHLAGIAKEQSIKNLFTKLTDFYYDNPSNKGIPLAVQSINKRHHELLKDYADHILPLIFFAMHEELNEENTSNVELWKDLWIEISPGDAGIRMNLDAFIALLEKALNDPSWPKKAQGANSIKTIAKRLKNNLEENYRIQLINMLLKIIGGRTFQGKERILEALASLCKNLNKEDPLASQIIEAALTECRKEEPLYRTLALNALGDILDELEADKFEEVYKMVWYLLDKKDLLAVTGDIDTENVSSDERNKRAQILNKLKEAVCETLGKCWPANSIETQQKYQVQFVERCIQCLQDNTRPVQVSLLIALGRFVSRLKIFDDEIIDNSKEKKIKVEPNRDVVKEKICKEVLSAVVYAANIPHTGLKKECLNIILSLVKRLSGKENEKCLKYVRKIFEETLPAFQKDNSPEVKCRIKDIEDKFRKS